MKTNSRLLSSPRPDLWSFAPLTDEEFRRFAKLIYDAAGVHMTSAKKPLVQGRLTRRLRHFGLSTYSDYLRLLKQDPEEMQQTIDLLTTHETSFFRHPSQFELLSRLSAEMHGASVWSAACSTGEEVYTIAMVLAEAGVQWQITATDVSVHAIDRARAAEYSIRLKDQIPQPLLKKYCLRGTGEKEGVFKISRQLRSHVRFFQMNLLEPPPFPDTFDIIFIRNVIIYFDAPTRERVVANLMSRLKSGGVIFLGGSESLRTLDYGVEMLMPAVYRKP